MVWRRLRSWSLVVVGALIAGMVMAASGPASAQTKPEPMLYLSSTSGGNAGGVSFADEDILRFDQGEGTWSMVFDGSDVGVGGSDVDAFRIVADPALGDEELVIELSFEAPRSISGLGSIDDSDIVVFTGTGGPATSGTFSRLTDFSDIGLSSDGEDVDAWTGDGSDFLLSTFGGVAASGASGADEDLFRFVPTALGDPTAGTLERFFDGSDVMPTNRDLVAAWFDEGTDQLYGSFLNGLTTGGVTADGDDVVVFTGNYGSATSGTFELFFDGDANGWVNEQIDGLHVVPGVASSPGEADLAVAIDDDVTDAAPAGSTVTFTVDVTNAGPADAEDVAVVLTLPDGLAFAGTGGCDNDGSTPPCQLGTVPAGTTTTFTFQGQLSADPGTTVTTGVAAAATNPDPGMTDNSATVDTDVAIAPTAVDDGPASNSAPGDPFHIAEDQSLSLTGVDGLLANDDLGDPAGLTITFGGGDLGGTVTSYAAGETAPISPNGSLLVRSDGGLDFTPADGFSGNFLFDYAVGNAGGTSVATVEILVGERPQLADGDLIFVSSTSGGNVDGVVFADEDILRYDTASDTWSMFFDASDVQLGASDIDGFDVISADPENTIIDFTVTAARNHDQIGPFDDSDVVRFEGVSGPDTSGTLTLRFDGSDVGLSLNGEDLDALAQDPAGNIAFSTLGNHNVAGLSGGRDEDLTLFEPLVLGPTTAGDFSVLLDGSDIGLGAKDIRAAEINPFTGEIYTMTPNTLRVDGLVSDQDDIIVHTGDTGPDTTGTWSLFWDGDLFGFGGEQIDGVSIEFANAAPEANPDRAATDEDTPITIGPDDTRSISSPGGDISKIAIDPRTGNYVVLGSIDGQTQAQLYDPVNRRVLETETLAGFARQPVGVDFHPQKDLVAIVTAGINEAFFYDEDLSTQVKSLALDFQPRSVTVNPTTGEVIIGGVDVTKIYDLDLDELLHTIEHEGLVASGLDIHERTGEIVAVLYEDQGAFAPGQIQWWDADGQLLTTLNSVDTNFPFDLSIDQATGDFAVPNNDTGDTVTVFDENGNTLAILGGFGGPRGVAFDPATGNLVVVRSQGWLIDATTGALIDGFFDEWTGALAVQPTTEGILAASSAGGFDSGRLAMLSPTTRNQSALARGFIVDVATDPTSGRIAVLDGAAVSSRQLEIYDPTGTTLLHSMTVPAASVAFHPDSGAVAVSLRTGEFRLYDPTLTTQLASFPLGSSDSLGVQPGTGNIVTRFGLSQAKILDPTGSEIGSITSSLVLDVAVDPFTGNIAIAGPNAGTEIWDPTGTTLLGTIPTPLAGDFSVGVAFGGTGNLVIAHDKSGSLDVMARGLLANDADPDGDPLTVTGFDATSANGATVTVNPDGSFTYDPTGVAAIAALRSGETLADTFTYTIDDGNGGTAIGTATIFVAGVNDAPVLGGPTAVGVDENTAAVTNYDATDDRDSEGSGLTYSLIGTIDDGLFTIDPDTGLLAFATAPDFENPADADTDNVYEISVKVTDANGSGDAEAVTVTVNDVLDTGSITIIQETDTDHEQDFGYSGDLGVFSLDDDATAPFGDLVLSNTQTFSGLDADTYVVTQDTVSFFALTDISCSNGATVDLEDRQATIQLGAGDAITCTFTNLRSGSVTVSIADSPDPVLAGQALSYVVAVQTNLWPALDPVITVDLPAGVTFSSAGPFGPQCTLPTAATVVCSFPSIFGTLILPIEVTVDPTTSGSISATASVAYDNLVDPNTADDTATAVTTVNVPTPGSAADDAYDSLGNVGITVPVVGGLLDNDTNGSAGQNTVGAVQGSAANVGAAVATDQGGSATVASTGSFLYTPPPGFEGDDTFTYTIDDGIAGANPNETATVTITVDEVIWFIDAGQPVQGSGTQTSPFNSIDGTGFATAADDPGDVIYLTDVSAPYSGAFTLKDDQVLLGEGSTLSIADAAGFTVPSFSFVLPAPVGTVTTRPEVQAGSGTTITLATGNVVRGLDISSTTGPRIAGTNVGDVVLADLTVDVGGPSAIDLDYTGANTGAPTLDNVLLTGNGVVANNAAVTVTTGDTAAVDLTIVNSSFLPGGPITRGFELTAGGNSAMTYRFNGNTLQPNNTFGVWALAQGSASMDGEITGNQITHGAGVAGNSIIVEAADNAQHRSRVAGNTLVTGRDVGGAVRAEADSPNVGGSARMDATISGNTITIGQNVNFGRGLQLVDHGSNTVCGNIFDNSVTDASTNIDVGISVVDQGVGTAILFEGLGAPVSSGGAIGILDVPWLGNNNSSNADGGNTFLQGSAAPGTCTAPILP